MKFILIIVFNTFAWCGLIHPINQIKLSYIHVKFEWEEALGDSDYQFELSKSSDFSNILISENIDTPYFIDKNNISWESSYYWRVKSNNDDWKIGSFLTGQNSVTFQNDTEPIEILEYKPDIASNGLTIFGSYYNNYSAAIDMNGSEVWNSGSVNSHVFFTLGKNNSLLGGKFLPDYNNSLIGCEFSINDSLLWTEPMNLEVVENEAFIQHEIIKLPNGNYMGFIPIVEEHPVPTYINFTEKNEPFSWEDECQLYIEYNENYDWKGEKIVEWHKDTGEIVWEWNVFDYFSLKDFDYLAGHWETACNTSASFDWIHFNALFFNESDNSLYVSSRHLDRITKIDYTTKNIIWNLGIPWLGDEVLVPDTLFSGQHGLQILSNGNIVTLDNGIHSQYTTSEITSPVTRAIEIEVVENDGNFSANTVWSYTLPYDLYGALSGNAQKLNNGNYLINTIGNIDGAYSVEVTQDGEVAWKCRYNLGEYATGPLYRAMRIKGLYEYESLDLAINNYEIPQSSHLKSIYPNPFNPIVNIEYEITVPMEIEFNIFNLNGQKVDNINFGYRMPGIHLGLWDGSSYPSGIYFMRLGESKHTLTQKMILLK